MNAVINGIAMHSTTPLEVESVRIQYTDLAKRPLLKEHADVTPHLEDREYIVDMAYVN